MIFRNLAKTQQLLTARSGLSPQHRRFATDNAAPKSAHSQWYKDSVPAMIPIFLLGSAVYLGLQLTQQKLSHQKALEEAHTRLRALEEEVALLEQSRSKPSTTETERPPQPSKVTPTSWWKLWG